MQAAPYGFRIVGSCREARRVVDAAVALSGYAACDKRAEIETESYLSAFQFGDEFRLHLTGTGSTKGYVGACWSPWLWMDIDREDDIEAATRDARRLAAYVVDRYRLDGESLLIFFSGSKGYHVGLPTSLWEPQASTDFNKLARRFAENIAEAVGIAIDAGVYDKVRAFRAPNSRHPKTGRHKRRIAYDELLELKAATIVDSAAEPRPFDLPLPPPRDDQATSDWRTAVEQVAEATAAIQHRRVARGGTPKLNRQTLEFIRDGAPSGDRHRLLFSAAANLAEFGCPPTLAHALLNESALDSGLAPREVRRQIDCGLLKTGPESKAQDGRVSPLADSTEGDAVDSRVLK